MTFVARNLAVDKILKQALVEPTGGQSLGFAQAPQIASRQDPAICLLVNGNQHLALNLNWTEQHETQRQPRPSPLGTNHASNQNQTALGKCQQSLRLTTAPSYKLPQQQSQHNNSRRQRDIVESRKQPKGYHDTLSGSSGSWGLDLAAG